MNKLIKSNFLAGTAFPWDLAHVVRIFKAHWHALVFALLAMLASCTGSRERLAEGTWRGVLHTEEKEIPFNFILDYSGEIPVLTYRNGNDRFVTDSVRVAGDSLVFPVGVYGSELVAGISGQRLKGHLVNLSGKKKVSFEAHPDEEYRFWPAGETDPSQHTPAGRWEVTLINQQGGETPAVAEFQEEGERILGTVLTTTGDYRFLEGQLSGASLKLSSFAGGAANLLEVEFATADSLSGTLGGLSGQRKFYARRNDQAVLPDAYGLTYLKEGYETLEFTFPDLDGNEVSLDDGKYQNKVKIVTLMGTWCPNCMDEAAFLGPWYEENKERGVEVIALSFEQKDDLDFARSRFEKFSKRFPIGYDVLFAGRADKQEAADKLPALNTVLSFPTTIFIDREGRVRKIHTGFSGPATGSHYEKFKEEFNSTVDQMLDDGKQKNGTA